MFKKNSVINGILVGVLLPPITYILLGAIFMYMKDFGWIPQNAFNPIFPNRTIAIVSIAINAIAMNIFQKRKLGESLRGIVFPTLIYVIVWLVMFWDLLFD